jgi:toxin ParE1/3/4
MAIVKYTKPALQDLKNIHDYIANDSAVNAKRFIQAIKDHVTILNKYPEIGSQIFTNRYNNLRQLLHKSYRIIYYYENDIVTIITIHHQSRLIENIKVVKDFTK